MPLSSLTQFHHWLLIEASEPAPFVLLHTLAGAPLQCAATITRHLNEFDETGTGPWLAPAPDLIEAIASDPAQRRLLGVPEPCPACGPTSRCGLRRVLERLARRGRVVLDHPEAMRATAELPRGFRVAIGRPPEGLDPYHLVINPEHFGARCLAPLIGDCFLEWAASTDAREAA